MSRCLDGSQGASYAKISAARPEITRMATTQTKQHVSELCFEGWLKNQKIDLRGQPAETVASLRGVFEKALVDIARARQSVMFSEPCPAGEYRYAIALEDRSELRLVLVIRRSAKGEYFMVYPRDADSDPHASYHLKGDYHQKSYKRKFGKGTKRQPLGPGFKGREHLGSFGGLSAAAPICDPANFTAVVRVPEGVVDSFRGSVMVDLVEPGIDPDPLHRQGTLCQ
jgi:hypothetical protein